MRSGFASRRSLGNRGFSNNKFEVGDSSDFWRESSNDCEDNQTRNRGFSKRGGYQDGNDSEASGSSRRGGRGSFRGCRRGFGLGSPNSKYEQDEGTQHSSGIFGSRRSALSGTGYQDGNDSEASGSSRRDGRHSKYEQDEGTQHSGGIFGSRRSALSGAGYQDGNDSEASGSPRRGRRGSFRGCRGGFGLGSPNSKYEQDEGTQHSGGIFGSRRSALSGTGYQDGNDSEASGSSRRDGRHSKYEQDEGTQRSGGIFERLRKISIKWCRLSRRQ